MSSNLSSGQYARLTRDWTQLGKLLNPTISSHCIREVERYNRTCWAWWAWGREEYEAFRKMNECLDKYRERQ